MRRYTGNKLYDFLKKPLSQPFYWVAGQRWLLVYGNKNDEQPRLILSVSEGSITSKMDEEDKLLFHMGHLIATKAQIEHCYLKYEVGKNQFLVRQGKDNSRYIDRKDFIKILSATGLDVVHNKTGKDINSASSSAYHDWQRANLGDRIIVSDIDLIRLRKREIVELIELKRSFISIDQWKPFTNDFPNFRLMGNLCKLCQYGFYLIYNQNKDAEDDISRLKVYKWTGNKETPFTLLGIESPSDFLDVVDSLDTKDMFNL